MKYQVVNHCILYNINATIRLFLHAIYFTFVVVVVVEINQNIFWQQKNKTKNYILQRLNLIINRHAKILSISHFSYSTSFFFYKFDFKKKKLEALLNNYAIINILTKIL
jgi:hypothetical protein